MVSYLISYPSYIEEHKGEIHLNAKTFLAIAVTLLFWSSAFAGIREGLTGGYTAGHLVLLRYVSASLVFVIYSLFKRIQLPKLRDIPLIAGLGFIGISIYHIALTYGELTVPAGTASLLIAAAPAFTALVSSLYAKEYLSKMGWVGILIGFSGIAYLTLGSHQEQGFTKGALLVLLSAVCTSLFFVIQKPLFKKYRPLDLTAYFTWFGTLPMLIFVPGFFHQLQVVPLTATLSGIYIGVFPAAIAYVAWTIALASGQTNIVTSSLYLNPVLAIFIAWIWLGELPHMNSIIGGAIALLGVIVVNIWGKTKPRSLGVSSVGKPASASKGI